MSAILASFDEEDRSKLSSPNELLPVKVPVFTYNNFSGKGDLYVSNVYDGRVSYISEEDKNLSSREVIDWKCTERIRIRIDDLFVEAYTIYIYYPNNTSGMFLKIEEASDLYRKLRTHTLNRPEFLRQYLYYGMANQLNQRSSNFPFACSLFKEAKETNSELARRSENKQLVTATFNVDTSLASLQRRSGCL
ncbi:hypothetical protein EHQ52_03915 [Leptospira koniambonensis]|uniref:Uncharacterized protein n=1 Tax=Leptospira koniambonensis TaxID=2484950 RepID=A0A4R9JCU9_9LEPT|nr:hypothetical protein [Leptospira koniambonensis]TGL35921.1 hypothetical protein EHQ52_03915 [Leptospira koniambonensis]